MSYKTPSSGLLAQKQILVWKRKPKPAVIIALIFLSVLMIFSIWVMILTYSKKSSEAEIEQLRALVEEQGQQIQTLKEEPIVVNALSPEIVLKDIETKISSIAELATVEYLYTDVAIFTDAKEVLNIEIPFTEKSFMLKWSGTIKAGVDLSKVSVEVRQEEMRIIVSVPRSEILSYEVDNDSVELLDEKNSIFNSISVNDKIQFDKKTEQEMRKRAIENGILTNAQTNAEDTLYGLLSSIPELYQQYTIEFIVVKK